jgi:hypothetical protein
VSLGKRGRVLLVKISRNRMTLNHLASCRAFFKLTLRRFPANHKDGRLELSNVDKDCLKARVLT